MTTEALDLTEMEADAAGGHVGPCEDVLGVWCSVWGVWSVVVAGGEGGPLMPKNTGRGSRGAREAAAASHGRIPAGAFALRGQSVGVFREQRLLGGLFGGSRSRIIHIMVWKGGER